MKHCESCHAMYPDEFAFCPMDQNALRATQECPSNKSKPVFGCTSKDDKSAHWRTRIWFFTALAIVAVGFAVWALVPANSSIPAIEDTPQNSTPVERRSTGAVRTRSGTNSRRDARTNEPAGSAKQSSDVVENVHAQELVATGYRRLQQHDFEAAQDAFEQALDIQPDNVPAQKGLKAAKTAQSVKGIAGVFRR